MQKTVSLFVICTSFLVFVGACVWGVAGAQEQPAPTPTPYVLASMSAKDGVTDEVITGTGEIEPLNPAILEMVQKRLEEAMANDELIVVSGKETMGKVIAIAGKEIQLPPNVYSEAFVTDAVGCDETCPAFPAYLLRYTDSDAQIWVSEKSGAITDVQEISLEKVTANRVAFQWLVEALAKENAR